MSDIITRLNTALEGRYRIERLLGSGGMATVYLAHDIRHGRDVALKVLQPELAAVVGADRFLAEIQTTARLQHPHILPLFDSGTADSFVFYVMPYVEGESLRQRLDREGQLPVHEAVSIVSKVAEALDYAHAKGVIHRDVKPANILLLAGEPLVADFGIALAVGHAGAGRLTETGLSLGTPSYMSPEQATGDQKVGPATDTYALGCVLYEALVGEPPYTGATPQAILGKILTGEPVSAARQRSTVPAHVDDAIRRALQRIPADRFTPIRDFARALSEPDRAQSAVRSDARRGRAWVTRRELAFMGVGVVMGGVGILVLGGLAGFVLAGPPAYVLTVVDREGDAADLPIPAAQFRIPRVSPDGRRVAVTAGRGGASDLWVYDIESGAGLRLTHNEATNGLPIWSPDGGRIYFNSTLDWPGGNIYAVASDGSAAPRRVTTAEESQAVTGITPDGSTILYTVTFGETRNIMAIPANAAGESRPLVRGRFRSGTGDVSPDGRWLAYRSDESGAFEVYVQPFPGPGPKVPVSIGGGNEPVWSADGRELFYRRGDGWMIAATISEGPTVTSRVELFDAQAYRLGGSNPREYHVTPDGRFLMLRLDLAPAGGGVLDELRRGFQQGWESGRAGALN